MDFEQIYQERVEKCSHETAFNKEEALALYNLCWTIPLYANVVEIGVEYGRSTAVIGSVSQERGVNQRGDPDAGSFDFLAVDPDPHIDELQLGIWKLPIRLARMTSKEAFKNKAPNIIDLIHIDGDHTYEAVSLDCHMWLPYVRKGGYVCFDDYGHPGLEGVQQAVDEYFSHRAAWGSYNAEWQWIGKFGNKLAVYRRCGY